MKWGLRVELLFIFIFVVCLLIATVGLNYLGVLGEEGAFDSNSNRYEYNEIENIVASSALKYYNDRFNYTTDDITVRTSTLISLGYMSNIHDEKGRTCKGYARIINGKNSISYIKCPGYKTDGYNKDYE